MREPPSGAQEIVKLLCEAKTKLILEPHCKILYMRRTESGICRQDSCLCPFTAELCRLPGSKERKRQQRLDSAARSCLPW